MKFSQGLIKTRRDLPSDAELISHQLMIKAGLISQVFSGVYTFLPLGMKVLEKIKNIVRQEMNKIMGLEILMPALQPKEIWDKSERSLAFGDSLFRFKDRRDRSLVLAPTHEEVVTLLAKDNIQSYKDLPLMLYQIQTKFRDEPRPRGGLLRVREFDMKDAYSFHDSWDSLDQTYTDVSQAYESIFTRCNVNTLGVEADSGAIGGKDSQEYMAPLESGEDTVIKCVNCGYAANLEKAVFKLDDIENTEASKSIEKIETPNVTTIEDLSNFLNVDLTKILKTICYVYEDELIFAVIRGDLEINEIKLGNILGGGNLRLANKAEIENISVVGFTSPVNLPNVKVILDSSLSQGVNFIGGANEKDFHLLNINPKNDFNVEITADIGLVPKNGKCLHCGSDFEFIRGMELGHIFKLGDVFSKKLEAFYLNKKGERIPLLMGCYGIGIGRLLAAIIESNYDDDGIIFPPEISPFDLHLIGLNLDDIEVVKAAQELYAKLQELGIDVIFDDRDNVSPGVKFKDSDLIGVNLRAVISKRNIENNVIEFKFRNSKDVNVIETQDLTKYLKSYINKLN